MYITVLDDIIDQLLVLNKKTISLLSAWKSMWIETSLRERRGRSYLAECSYIQRMPVHMRPTWPHEAHRYRVSHVTRSKALRKRQYPLSTVSLLHRAAYVEPSHWPRPGAAWSETRTLATATEQPGSDQQRTRSGTAATEAGWDQQRTRS